MLGELQGPQSGRCVRDPCFPLLLRKPSCCGRRGWGGRQWWLDHMPGAWSGALCRWSRREQGSQARQDTVTHGRATDGKSKQR